MKNLRMPSLRRPGRIAFLPLLAIAICLTALPKQSIAQCLNLSNYQTNPAPTPPGSVTNYGIYAGEYTTFTALSSGNSYTVGSSVSTDYLTVTHTTPSGTVEIHGTQPLQFVASTSGTYYVHITTDAACNTENVGRDITLTSVIVPCLNTNANGTASAPTGSAVTTITCQFAGDYGQWNTLVAGTLYELSSTIPTDYITVTEGTATGTVIAAGIQPLIISPATSGTYYVHVNTNSSCGTDAVCRDVSMEVVTPTCTNSIAYGSQNAPSSPSTFQTIGCTYAEEYNTWNNFLPGITYSVSSSVSTDFITIREGTPTGPVAASGTTPVTFTPTNAGPFYTHINTNPTCGTESNCRDVIVTLPQPPVDMTVSALANPTSTGCLTSADTVVFTIANLGTQTIDFSVDPVTVNSSVTGPNPATFTPVVINTGTLAPGATQNVIVNTAYNMASTGTYSFIASTSVSGDGFYPNDTMMPVSIINNAPVIAVTSDTVCIGSSATVSATGYTGSIQWQESTDSGNSWNNSTASGNTSSSMAVTPTVTTMYQALVCGTPSSSVTVTPYISPDPVVTNDTICGSGIANLSGTGTGDLLWFDTPTGNNFLHNGSTFAPAVSSTTTYYVTNASGGSTGNVGLANAVTGAQQTSTAYLNFDVYQPTVLAGVHVYPGAAGNVVLELLDDVGTLITSATVPVTSADIGNKTFIPLFFNLTPGTNFRLAQGIGSVSMYRESAGVSFPYTLPGVVSITGSSAGASYYYFSYDWIVSTSCPSNFVPVTAVVTTPPAMSLNTATDTICAGDSTQLVVSSSHTAYSYSWTPASGLSSATGSTVQASPSASTMYIVTASDTAGCNMYDTVFVTVNPVPSVIFVNPSASAICDNQGAISLVTATPTGGTFTGPGVSGNSFDPIAAGPGTHILNYTYTDGNGCSGSDTSSVEVISGPTVNLGNALTQCGGTITLDAGNPGSDYLWSTMDTTQVITVGTTATYDVTVTAANGCVETDSVDVSIFAVPTVNLGNDTTICVNHTITFDAGSGYSSYQWSNNANTQTITVNTGGNYEVTVTTADGCTDTDTLVLTIDPCTGITENQHGISMTVMPNPSNGSFTLLMNGNGLNQVDVQIVDITGKVVVSASEGNLNGSFRKEFNLEGIANGVYFLRSTSGNSVLTERLIIQ